MKILITASLGANFTGSYKKRVYGVYILAITLSTLVCAFSHCFCTLSNGHILEYLYTIVILPLDIVAQKFSNGKIRKSYRKKYSR